MGLFALENSNDTKELLEAAIANIDLFVSENPDNQFNYLLITFAKRQILEVVLKLQIKEAIKNDNESYHRG